MLSFPGTKLLKEDCILFCLEPYQELFTIMENHITDGNIYHIHSDSPYRWKHLTSQ